MSKHQWDMVYNFLAERCEVCGAVIAIPERPSFAELKKFVYDVRSECPGKPKEKPGLPEKLSPLSSCRLVRSDVAQDKAIDAIIDYLKAREK